MADDGHPPAVGIPANSTVQCKIPTATLFIETLTDSDVDEAARFYIEVFLADEPTTHRVAPEPVRLLSSAQWYVSYLARGGQSYVARDGRTGEITGVIFCFDIADDFGEERDQFARYLSHFREAVAMIDELELRYLDTSGTSPGSVLHAFQGAVSRQYRGCGVMKAMVHVLITCARERGYQQIVADCTSQASQRVLEQCGFHQLGYLAYDAFFIDGVRFFEGLEGGISLMVLDITHTH